MLPQQAMILFWCLGDRWNWSMLIGQMTCGRTWRTRRVLHHQQWSRPGDLVQTLDSANNAVAVDHFRGTHLGLALPL